jgi:hypothetical protein
MMSVGLTMTPAAQRLMSVAQRVTSVIHNAASVAQRVMSFINRVISLSQRINYVTVSLECEKIGFYSSYSVTK